MVVQRPVLQPRIRKARWNIKLSFQKRTELLRQQELNELKLQKGRNREVSCLLQLLLVWVYWWIWIWASSWESRQSPEQYLERGCYREGNWKRFWWRLGKFQAHGRVSFSPKHTPQYWSSMWQETKTYLESLRRAKQSSVVNLTTQRWGFDPQKRVPPQTKNTKF